MTGPNAGEVTPPPKLYHRRRKILPPSGQWPSNETRIRRPQLNGAIPSAPRPRGPRGLPATSPSDFHRFSLVPSSNGTHAPARATPTARTNPAERPFSAKATPRQRPRNGRMVRHARNSEVGSPCRRPQVRVTASHRDPGVKQVCRVALVGEDIVL